MTENFTRPSVYVVDDDPSTAALVRVALAPTAYSVELFDSAEAFLERAELASPGCIILDFNLPRMTGLQLQEQLVQRAVRLPILFLSGESDIATAVAAMKNQAVDFIVKPFDAQQLRTRVSQAVELSVQQSKADAHRGEVAQRLATLTPREREVMGLVVSGLANKQVAMRLTLSEKTVEIHRGNAMRKMQADSLADLVKMAILTGVTAAESITPAPSHFNGRTSAN